MNNSHFKKFQTGKASLGKAMHRAKKQLMPNDRRAPVLVAKPKPKPTDPNQKSIF
jgi:hypothetical protein